jgi:hypothetical protein
MALEQHTDNAAPIIFTVGAIIGAAFEAQMIVIFLCAVLGAGIGLAFRPAPEPAKSKFEIVLRFAGNTGWILITAVMICFASYWTNKWFAGAHYPLAFFLALLLMIYRELITTDLGKAIKRRLEAL